MVKGFAVGPSGYTSVCLSWHLNPHASGHEHRSLTQSTPAQDKILTGSQGVSCLAEGAVLEHMQDFLRYEMRDRADVQAQHTAEGARKETAVEGTASRHTNGQACWGGPRHGH